MDLDNDNPWVEILLSTMFTIWSTVHTTKAAYSITIGIW